MPRVHTISPSSRRRNNRRRISEQDARRTNAEWLAEECARDLLQLHIEERLDELDEIASLMGANETWPEKAMRIHLDRWEMAELEVMLARRAQYHHLLPRDLDVYSLPRNCYHWSYFDPDASSCIQQKSLERLPSYCYEAKRLHRYIPE